VVLRKIDSALPVFGLGLGSPFGFGIGFENLVVGMGLGEARVCWNLWCGLETLVRI
jgi:hypothetical protein